MDTLNGIAYYVACLVNLVVTGGVMFFCGLAVLLVISMVWRATHPKRDAKYVAAYLALALVAGASRVPATEWLDENNQWMTLASVAVNAASVALIVAAHWVSQRIEVEHD